MIQSTSLFRYYRVRFLWLALVILAMLVCHPALVLAQQQARYETPPVLSASKILPPQLLSGPNFRVEERVVNDGFMNIYKIDSRYGTFTAVSTVAGGSDELAMINDKGVVIALTSDQSGTQLAAGPAGMSIKLK